MTCRIRGHGAGRDYDETLRSVGGARFGHYEWTAHGAWPRRHSPAAADLLRIGRAVHLADRLVRRGHALSSQLRELRLDIGVTQPARWRRQRHLLEDLLEFATGGDSWRLDFHTVRRDPPVVADRVDRPARPTTVALFSGGLDSLCGAAYQAAQPASRPLFVTHSPPGREATIGLIGEAFSSFGRSAGTFSCISYRLEPREASRAGMRSMFQEPTRRTRPFFYLSLACATALAFDVPHVQMSENGALALSLPYRSDVHGPSMARQAHTFLIAGFEALLRAIDPGAAWVVANPFVNETKGEACLRLGPAAGLAARSASCEYLGRQRAVVLRWIHDHPRRARTLGNGPQCGLCIPCLVRRAALKRAGIADEDSAYFASAQDVLRRIHARDGATDVFGGTPPPLLRLLASNALYLERFCQRTAQAGFADFAIQYLPELRANRSLSGAAPVDLRGCFTLARRYAGEMLAFLHG